MLAACGPYTIVFFTVVVFFGAFYLINLMLAVVAMSYDDEAGVNSVESNAKKLTDYREESTFSFDPGKLPLVLLQKGHQKSVKGRHGSSVRNRSQRGSASTANHHQQPQVAELAWALAKGEASKLTSEAAQHRASRASADSSSIHITPAAPPPDEDPGDLTILDPIVAAGPDDPSIIADRSGDLGGFTLQICEPRNPLDVKDCDSGVHPANFASSFNTDVGYSSETSRAPSYPSSVVFKRRTFTNKSVSQNYSSLTESIGSIQPPDTLNLCPMEGDEGEGLPIRYSPSPITPLEALEDLTRGCRRMRPSHHHHHHNNGESRRLSYKRACDPDKRISMAFDSMLSGDSELSYCSHFLPHPHQPCLSVLPVEPNAASSSVGPARSPSSPQQTVLMPESGHVMLGNHSVQFLKNQHVASVAEASETDNHWLKRRQSYQQASSARRTVSNHGILPSPKDHQGRGSSDSSAERPRRLAVAASNCLRCCWSAYGRVRSVLNRIVSSPWMDFCITISIILNTAFLAAEHHGMSPDVKEVLDVGNKVTFFSLLFQLLDGIF